MILNLLKYCARLMFQLNCNPIALVDAVKQTEVIFKIASFKKYMTMSCCCISTSDNLKFVKCINVRLQFAAVGAWYLCST